jgi:hypothetical protein
MPHIGPLSPGLEEELEWAPNRLLEVAIHSAEALEEVEPQG